MQRRMFYGASPHLFVKAKELRLNMTPAEKLLWMRLRQKQLTYRFKPQHPVDIFIADFYCHALKLIIEVDGPIHDTRQEYDNIRTEELKNNDLTVIRFTNDEVINNIESVISRIKEKIQILSAAAPTLKGA